MHAHEFALIIIWCVSPFFTAYRYHGSFAGFASFDANEKTLFDVVVLHWAQGNPLTVRMAIGLSGRNVMLSLKF